MMMPKDNLRVIRLRVCASAIFALIFMTGCGSIRNTSKPVELIDFITIESGRTTDVNISEVFSAKKYDVRVLRNPDVDGVYDPISASLKLTPGKGFQGVALIDFFQEKEKMVLPVIVIQKQVVEFRCTPGKAAQNVFVMGNFNNWNRSGDRMLDPDGDGTYTAEIALDDGIYEYQFVIDQSEIFDLQNPEKVDNGFGYFNSLLRIASAQKSMAPQIHFLPYDADRYLRMAIRLPAALQKLEVVVLLNNEIYPAYNCAIEDQTAVIDICPLANRQGIDVLRVFATNGNSIGNVQSVWLENGSPVPQGQTFIWQDATIYSLMVDRFEDGDATNDDAVNDANLDPRANFMGGDFAGIRQKIEDGYFERLGVNTLWISPVNETTDLAYQEWPEPHRWFSGYHGYWPIHPRRTEPRFGSLREFRALVRTAHAHGIKILLDFVSNHTHQEHVFFQKHRDWFGTFELPDGTQNIRRWDEYRLTTWFDTFLPSFDYEKSDDAVEAMTDYAVWWLNRTGIDGFRHDATKHVPYKFWKRLSRKVKQNVNPYRDLDAFQIGETFGGYDLIKSYVNNSMLNAQFSFNQFFTARRVFAEEDGDFRDLSFAIQKAMEVYGYNHVMGNIMDSHDQIRMMAFLDGDLTLSDDGTARAWQDPQIRVDHPSAYAKELVLFTYLLTVPGVPIIYYGDEFGMTGANDPDNRRMMRFDRELSPAEKTQLAKTSQLIHLRQQISALRRGDFIPLYADRDVLIFSRGDLFGRVIVALNKGAEFRSQKVQLPAWLGSVSLISLIDGNKVDIAGTEVQLELAPLSGNIWRVE